MKTRLLSFVLFFLLCFGNSILSFSQGLFESDEPMAIELKFSIKQLKSETDDSTFMDSQLFLVAADGQKDTLDIEIRTRGNFRLENCFYPPMRLKMKKKGGRQYRFQRK